MRVSFSVLNNPAVWLLIRFFLVTLLLEGLLLCSTVWAEVPEGKMDDCQKCHSFQVKMVTVDGGRHATAVSCTDCHLSHPPEGELGTVTCSDCHTDQPHFSVGNCRSCHTDPHRPLVTLRDTLKPARKECLSCHADVGRLMRAAPSKHADLFCTRCHNRHKESPSCIDCHAPHQQNQNDASCIGCHSPHQPRNVRFVGYVPASFCRTCHKQEADDLAKSNSNHGGLNCTYCHSGLHPTTPSCQDCHGLPHTQSQHSQFRDCLECHGDAHRLMSR